MHAPVSPERMPSRAYSAYVLSVLVGVYVVNYVDRQLISILIEPIKAEFGASDTQMGLLTGFAFAIWKPVFLMRVHDFSMAEAGLWIGLLSGATGFVSTLVGGVAADWLARRNLARALQLCAFSILAALPFQLAFLFYPNPMIALALFIPGGLVGGMWPPPSYAATQNLVPPHMRALASAILLFFLNLIGLGAGPFAVGWLSDALAPRFGAESVRWALAIPLALNTVGAFAYWRASKSYAAELSASR